MLLVSALSFVCLHICWPICLVELLSAHPQMFSDGQQRRLSDASLQSAVSGSIDNIPLTTITTCECFVSISFYLVPYKIRTIVTNKYTKIIKKK